MPKYRVILTERLRYLYDVQAATPDDAKDVAMTIFGDSYNYDPFDWITTATKVRRLPDDAEVDNESS